MPAPSTSLATLRPDLGGSLEEFDLVADRMGFIGLRLMPVFEAAVSSGKFGRIPIAELLKNRETSRSSGSRYNSGDWKFTDDGFVTQENGFEMPIDDRESELYREYFDAELVAAEMARDIVLRNLERRVAALALNTDVIANAAGSNWTNWGSSTPIDDVEAAIRAAYTASGLWPNTLAISKFAFRDLRNSEQIIDRLKYAGFDDVKAEKVTERMLAQVFDLDQVLVSGGTKNSANEGQPAVPGEIWDAGKGLVCRVARSKNIKEPCFGRTIHWGEDGSNIGATIETYRDESRRSDIARARMDTHEKLLHVECAQILTGLAG